jgi:hypothetical protein
VVCELVSLIPPLKTQVDNEVEFDGEILPHIIFGDIFVPYLEATLQNHETNQDDVINLFIFLESMATTDDVKVQEVLAFSILERLSDDEELLNDAKSHMGPRTKRISDEVETYLGRI